MRSAGTRRGPIKILTGLAWLAIACGCRQLGHTSAQMSGSSNRQVSSDTPHAQNGQRVAVVEVDDTVTRSALERVGMNLGGQNYYDSGQMLKNLVFRNPGFEGETWQSVLHCVAATATSCTDANSYAQWPEDFLAGGAFEFISGPAAGEAGTILSMRAADAKGETGVRLAFAATATPAAAGDWVIVRKALPGNAAAGWSVGTYGGAMVSTELADLSPETQGRQALRLSASLPGQTATIDSYFDSTKTHNFVLMRGMYRLTFRAKGISAGGRLEVSFGRQVDGGQYVKQTVPLKGGWADYAVTFRAAETAATLPGTLDLRFSVGGADVLLDDVDLRSVGGDAGSKTDGNRTEYRDEVVETLRALHPGVLRYMDGLANFGSSVDNMIAPAGARVRTGSSTQMAEDDDVAMGLVEFLELCRAVGAEPWYNLPPGISEREMGELVEFLGGDASTVYGAKRAARGQKQPWTSVFPVIHLELGNEEWNYGTFPGNAINDPEVYARRVGAVFGAARRAAAFKASSFDLVMGTQVVNPWYTQQELKAGNNFDSVAIAPYLFGKFADDSSQEAIFGAMFAEPEMWDSAAGGFVARQASVVAAAGKRLEVYEENISTQEGSVAQASVDAVVPSVGAGVMMATHMLLLMRDDGVRVQNVWELPGYSNAYRNVHGGQQSSPVYGTVVDMGGAASRRRPVFLAAQLVNTAVMPEMLGVTVSGGATWKQPLSRNDDVKLDEAHALQVFAFTDGQKRRSVVAINLSRSASQMVRFTGENAPRGDVSVSWLSADTLTDSNEVDRKVGLREKALQGFRVGDSYPLPPFSVTVFRWVE